MVMVMMMAMILVMMIMVMIMVVVIVMVMLIVIVVMRIVMVMNMMKPMRDDTSAANHNGYGYLCFRANGLVSRAVLRKRGTSIWYRVAPMACESTYVACVPVQTPCTLTPPICRPHRLSFTSEKQHRRASRRVCFTLLRSHTSHRAAGAARGALDRHH